MESADHTAQSIVRREFRSLIREDYEGAIDHVPLAELGVDSLDFFEKLLYLEDEHGICISISELDEDVTLSDILSALRNTIKE